MRTQLINLRILHVCLVLAAALFVYQYTQWDDGLWIVISVLAIIGPFRPGLTINKAWQRVVGSLAGLLLSLILWLFIHYNYNLLVVIAVILVYCLAFSVLQEYTYFIMLVSVMLCINFDYMNLLFNNEIVYLVNRSICVFTGAAICLVFEYFVFRHSYTNAVSLVEQEALDRLISDTQQKITIVINTQQTMSIAELNEILKPVIENLNKLEELLDSCSHTYSDQSQTIKLANEYKYKLNVLYAWVSCNGFSIIQNH